jgi:uncharacterized membrane protein YdbT with pleckstrin-like domain
MQEHKRERVKKRISITDGDEQIVTVTRQFPVVLRRPMIVGLLIITAGIVPWSIAYGLNASWLPIANIWILLSIVFLLIYWVRAWVGWHYSVYVLTSHRVLIVKQSGFFSREVADLALHNIQNVNYAIKGIQGSLFGFGTVRIDTLSGSGALKLRYVYKPAKLQKQIMDAVHSASKKQSDGSTKKS